MVEGTAAAVEVKFRNITFRTQLALKTDIFTLTEGDGSEFSLNANVGSFILGEYE